MQSALRAHSTSTQRDSDIGPIRKQQSSAVRVLSAAEWAEVTPVWDLLYRTSPCASFYLSVEWVSAWLRVFAATLHPQILLFERNGQQIGACLLVRAVEKRGPFRLKRLYLNTGGEGLSERTLMEYNNILCLAGCEGEVARLLSDYIAGKEWDEFAIEGLQPGRMSVALDQQFSSLHSSSATLQSYYIDLIKLRESRIPFLKSLSANSRGQIARSMKLYAAIGPLKCEIARDVATALEFFNEMRTLHQFTWTARGQTGAFGPGRRLEFHDTLIRQASAQGPIHMVRVSAGEETIGVLYNFVRAGKVYFFQSGFHYKQNPRFKPGLVTHACTIQRYIDLGFDEYDFLVGDAQYKKQLSDNCRPLQWIVYSRPSLKLDAIARLRAVKRRLRPTNHAPRGAKEW